MTDPPVNESIDDGGPDPRESRRIKLRKIEEMGIDPWGGRFDDISPIGEIRSRADEIKFRKEDGSEIDLPSEWGTEGFDVRGWKSEQGGGEVVGPKVRAAGRIQLHRHKGKLRFIDINDRSGKIQLFIGKNQVGEEGWELAAQFDLGDIIGVDGDLRRTNTGELTIFVEKLHFLTKSLEPPPEKHKGLIDPELRQRMRYLDMAYNEGVLDRFVDRTKIVQSIRGTLADDRSSSKSKGRRCIRSPAERLPGRSLRITTRWICSSSCGLLWSCI